MCAHHSVVTLSPNIAGGSPGKICIHTYTHTCTGYNNYQPQQQQPMAPSYQGSAPPDPQAVNLYASFRSMTVTGMPASQQPNMNMFPSLYSALQQTTAPPSNVPITANTGFPYTYYPTGGPQAASPVYPSGNTYPAYPSLSMQRRM